MTEVHLLMHGHNPGKTSADNNMQQIELQSPACFTADDLSRAAPVAWPEFLNHQAKQYFKP